jgi:glycosyltransferase involved in cell wall biosynthesis
MKQLHILMVTHVVPYPPSAGNEIRVFRMLQSFKEAGFSVTLILKPIGNEEISNESVVGLNQVVDNLHIFDSRNVIPDLNGCTFISDDAESQPQLVNMQEGFCPPWFVSQVDRLIEMIAPDVVMAQYIFMSRIFLGKSTKNLLKIIDTHDLFSKKHGAVEKYGLESAGLLMTAEQESSLLNRADVLLAIQKLEYDELCSMAPSCRVVLTGFDVDISVPNPVLQERGVVLIVASSNEFNVRGTQEFIDYIWPLIRERFPEARLRLVGKVCERVHSSDLSVQKVGFARHLSDEYERASVVVNPCSVGTGLKIKTAEALAWGKAHVGWPVSADGLREFSDPPYIVAQDVVEFADAVSDLLLDVKQAQKLGAEAHKFSERYLGGKATYGPLISLLKSHVKTHVKARRQHG